MSLRSRILAVLIPVVLGYALLDHGLQRWILEPSFGRLEAQAAREDLERLQRSVEQQAQEIAVLADAEAALPRFPAFLVGQDAAFISDYFSEAAFRSGRVDLAWIVAADGEVRFAHLIDPAGRSDVRLKDFVRGRWATGHPLLGAIDGLTASVDTMAPVIGCLATESGPLVVASAAIQDKQNPGRSLGRVILGRFLGSEEMVELSAFLGHAVDFWTLEEARNHIERDLFDELTSSPVPVTRLFDDNRLDSYATVLDVRAQPALIAHAASARPITSNGSRVIQYALLSTLGAGLLLLLVLLRTLQGLVLKPIAGLTAHAEHIGKTDDTTLRIGSARKDELGILGREFDRMLEKLATSRRALVDTARAAGMSEIATGILHNVGNVLNSVGVSGSLLQNIWKGSQTNKLSLVVGLLEEQQDLARFVTEDPRGKKLVPLLKALTGGIEQERGQALAELESLNRGLGHIKELVASQQAYATRTSLREVTHLPELVEEALTMTARAVGEFRQIDVARDFAAIQPAPVDRHKVLEVLVNVIQNARQAMDDAGRQDAKLELAIRPSSAGRVAIVVRDNGIGIATENLAKIFNHGFTTKRAGHGFGLHSAANSATELGGTLTGSSPGPGKGAEFILDIPYAVKQVA
jgi:two-component system, NtrC family, sensor kinase